MMENVNPMHRFRMTYGKRRFLDEETRATPLELRQPLNPIRPYPYFMEKLHRHQTPLTTLPVRNPRFIPDQPTFIPNEAFNPDTWWNSAMRDRRPWCTETESPYIGWPRTRLQSGILV